jgi:hypothetical protein
MIEIAGPPAAEGHQHGGAEEPALPEPAAVPRLTLIPPDRIAWMLATASRAPSIHNTQPWRFRVGPHAIELYADPRRRLRRDRAGREMLMSCGAALFGLRLAVRELGFLPAVALLPDRAQPELIARVALGPRVPVTDTERRMLEALPHRHTHRGPFEAGALPSGLLAALQHDAFAEGATLALIDMPAAYPKLAALVEEATRAQALNPLARKEILRWSRIAGSAARDGIPATAFPQVTSAAPGRLAQRDFDLGRHLGQLPATGAGEPPPAATMVLVTPGDDRGDWLAAGQALHRVLAHAATAWVSASLHSQPLEFPVIRDMIRTRLALPGAPQMLLQLGVTRSSLATPRRAVTDLLI